MKKQDLTSIIYMILTELCFNRAFSISLIPFSVVCYKLITLFFFNVTMVLIQVLHQLLEDAIRRFIHIHHIYFSEIANCKLRSICFSVFSNLCHKNL